AGMAGRSQDRSLREELTCAICCDLFSEPVMLDCMHHFCRGCIQEYWDRCAHGPSCPQCRRRFPSPAFRTHYLLSGLVDKVRRCGSQEHQHKMQASGFCQAGERGTDATRALCSPHPSSHRQFPHCEALSDPRLCKQSNRHSHPVHLLVCFSCGTHLLTLPSAQKVSGELNFKIRAEFARLHQILEEEERTVLAELGEKEEQSLAHLRRQVGQLEEGMAVLQRDIEHVKQTLSRMEDVSLLEVRCSADAGRRLRDVSGSQIGMGEVTANSLCFSLQVESLDIRYVPGMKLIPFSGAYLTPAPLTFDPESAHPNLVFSRDLTAVTERNQAQRVPISPRRFRQCVNVLGSQAFDSGRHYWEVWVGSKTKWDLGVAADTVDRAAKVKLCPENGYWTLRLRNRTEYWATATPWVRLTPRQPPQKVGVFLDCQEGTVTFFDAGDMSHIFTFHQVSAQRYCPFFSTCFSDGRDNMEPMRLCHLAL
ncbi:A33 protein, partial [Toxostoma redivivum]|nr:A33 protein [Toxostoma redivivum]